MIRIGLVLGAGGPVGQAYHAGILAALEQELGWDPRTAELLVGTSAGSIVATLLSLEVGAEDIAAHFTGRPPSPQAAEILALLRSDAEPLPPLTLSRMLTSRWRWPSPQLWNMAIGRPWALRTDRVVATLLPDGEIDLVAHAADALANPLLNRDWPSRLRICAARRSDARRVVFGALGAPDAELGEAVAASCAIPGYFAPVAIGGVRYFDGGVHSPTNADVARTADLDLVIVSSPMSTARGADPGHWGGRQAAHRTLNHEAARLRRAGVAVVRFEPSRQSVKAMGGNPLATDRSTEIVEAACLEASRWMNSERTATLLAPIGQRPASGRATVRLPMTEVCDRGVVTNRGRCGTP